MEIAHEHDLVVIEDAAQAPGAGVDGRFAGTLGHIGVYSLNYHKTIHCGEGGIAVTDDDRLAERLRARAQPRRGRRRRHGLRATSTFSASTTAWASWRRRSPRCSSARLDELTAPRIAHADRLTGGARRARRACTPPFVPGRPHARVLRLRRPARRAGARRPARGLRRGATRRGRAAGRGLRRRRCTASRSTASAPRGRSVTRATPGWATTGRAPHRCASGCTTTRCSCSRWSTPA